MVNMKGKNKLDGLFTSIKETTNSSKKISEILILLEACGKLLPIIANNEQKNQLTNEDLQNSQKVLENLTEKLRIISNELCQL